MPASRITKSLIVSSVESSMQMLSGVWFWANNSKIRAREGVLTLCATNCSSGRRAVQLEDTRARGRLDVMRDELLFAQFFHRHLFTPGQGVLRRNDQDEFVAVNLE